MGVVNGKIDCLKDLIERVTEIMWSKHPTYEAIL